MPDLDIFVPVLGRPHRAEPFMESLAESEPGDVRVTVVVSSWDHETAVAWTVVMRELGGRGIAARLGVHVLDAEPGSFAQKCNYAFQATAGPDPAPWLMLCGDDVAFHLGWWDAFTEHTSGAWSVIGTHTMGPIPDGGTPHPILRRSYVDMVGAGWDGPGVLCHEGYRHNYVDIEIAHAAQDRGTWLYPTDRPIEVEHLARYQHKAPDDETYRISDRTVAADRELYRNRAHANSPTGPR